MTLTQSDIASGLRELGLRAGDRVLVHSSLVALGQVEGGPDAVIDALLEVVGDEGLIVVPTFACTSPFDRRISATPLGAVPDTLWRRPNALRSMHPTHSVAAIGMGAEELIRDHEKAPTAYAEGTPYHRLATSGGKILLMGVDQDRNTTLHTAEALNGAAYLSDIEGTYVDDSGKQVTISIAAMAGPHRDFIGLDRLFRERRVMRVGKIGGAVCRLLDTGAMLETALNALKHDPAAMLCDNPNCMDCVLQRGRIKAARLAKEDFTLAAQFFGLADEDEDEDVEDVIDALKGEGISSVEMTAKDYRSYGAALANAGISVVAIESSPDDENAAHLAATLDVPLIVPVGCLDDFHGAMRLVRSSEARILMMNDGADSEFYEDMCYAFEDAPRLAFNPGRFADAGEKPFLEVFYRGRLRKQTAHFYIDDGVEMPGYGSGEIKEIISMLRCRSYSGVMTIRPPSQGIHCFRATAAAFWDLLDNM